jgi:hypothetical protein
MPAKMTTPTRNVATLFTCPLCRRSAVLVWTYA